jgi:hypothetical protein
MAVRPRPARIPFTADAAGAVLKRVSRSRSIVVSRRVRWPISTVNPASPIPVDGKTENDDQDCDSADYRQATEQLLAQLPHRNQGESDTDANQRALP